MANLKSSKKKNAFKGKYKRGAQPLADLLGKVLDPICAKRGFGTAELITWWPDIVGPEYENYTLPENIHWPRRDENLHQSQLGAKITIRVAPEKALFLQHEVPQLLERINAFLGYQAVQKIQLIQKDMPEIKKPQVRSIRELDDQEISHLQKQVECLKDESLEASLLRLGKAVLKSS